MKNVFYVILLCIIIVSCGKENSADGGSRYSDANHNANRHITESTNLSSSSAALAAASRTEIPALKGQGNTFLVYSSQEIGVNLCIEWDNSKKSQRWTAYQMTSSTNVKNWNRNNWDFEPFQPDPSLPVEYRTELQDYKDYQRYGCQRGHICPSADRLSSKTANEQTFYLSNIQPQYAKFNTGVWEAMEAQVRKWSPASDSRDTMFVCKGGTIDGDLFDVAGRMPIAKYFFMAVLIRNNKSGNGGYKAVAFWVEHLKEPQQSGDLSKYAISIDELEAKTGIDFFCNLPDDIEAAVESNYVPSVWGFK